MSVSLTSVFGDEISVLDQPRNFVKQYSAYAGANGLTAMCLGSRGVSLIVTGRYRVFNYASYALARAAMRTALDTINTNYATAAAQTWTYLNDTYNDTILDRIELVPDAANKTYHYNPSTLSMWVQFIAYFKTLI